MPISNTDAHTHVQSSKVELHDDVGLCYPAFQKKAALVPQPYTIKFDFSEFGIISTRR